MSTGFHRTRGGRLFVRFDVAEVAMLRGLLSQLVGMVAEGLDAGDEGGGTGAAGAAGASADPAVDLLAAAFGDAGPRAKPDDPALARLFPDAYPDDPEAASDFRRYTEGDLRARKVDAASVAARTLHAGGGRVELDPEQAQAWLGVLNDLRLTLGTRLEVTEEHEEVFGRLSDDDPRKQLWYIYDWLSFLQQSLVEALMKR